MTTLQPKVAAVLGAEVTARPGSSWVGWARRLEDPVQTYYRLPLARALTDGLGRSLVTPSRLLLARPLSAALAGYLLTFATLGTVAGALALVEARALLGCAAQTLSAARSESGANERAMRAIGDGASVVFLSIGAAHLAYHHALAELPRSVAQLTVLVVLLAVLAFGVGVVRGYRVRV
ncbi:MAG: hypothetical protein IPM79_08520 [Polyangiaceae bacterium]|nr:hypothetical protein [Polyangiaceae bacterium]